MDYAIYPVIDINDLADELHLQFGIDMDGAELSNFLFNEEYMNDCYKYYYYDEELVYEGKFWQNEENIRIRNCINSILQDTMPPDYVAVLVDVSW